MYSKEESKALKKEFWTSFGVYMKKYNKVYQNKIRWVNYKTNCKDIYFRLDADKKGAYFSIDLQHHEESMRALFYEQFTELKSVITEEFKSELIWEEFYSTPYGDFSKIYCDLLSVSVFNKNNWQEMFQFLEQNIINAHDFWEDFGEIFKNLEN